MDNEISKDRLLEIIHSFGRKPTLDELSIATNIGKGYLYKYYIKEYKLYSLLDFGDTCSKCEQEVFDSLQDLLPNVAIVQNDRTVLDGKELDILIPDYKVAVEVDGDYWHCSAFKEPRYHQEKTLECMKQGIELFHIFEHEVFNPAIKADVINTVVSRVIEPDTDMEIIIREYDIKSIMAATGNIEQFPKAVMITADVKSKYSSINGDTAVVYLFEVARDGYAIENSYYPSCDRLITLAAVLDYFKTKYKPSFIELVADISRNIYKDYLRLGFKILEVYEPASTWIRMDYTLSADQQLRLIQCASDKSERARNYYSRGYCQVYNSGFIKYIWEDRGERE